MSTPRLAATIRASLAALIADRGPPTERYAITLDRPATLFRWAVGSFLGPDGWTTLAPTGGGTPGAWLAMREADKGDDITGTGTLTVGGKRWQVITALAADATLTLATTNAAAGDRKVLTREDVSAFEAAVVNGGPGAGTVVTVPASMKGVACFYFDGTNWLKEWAIAGAAVL